MPSFTRLTCLGQTHSGISRYTERELMSNLLLREMAHHIHWSHPHSTSRDYSGHIPGMGSRKHLRILLIIECDHRMSVWGADDLSFYFRDL